MKDHARALLILFCILFIVCARTLQQSEHPSALSSFKDIMNAARGKSIVVFLDYDGTLSPIVSDPDRAFMSNPVQFTIYFVSGLVAICLLHTDHIHG